MPVRTLAGALADDGDLDSEVPKICVDYLSHQWAEEDVWRSWRSMTRAKYEIANGMRLENASWRTWWKQRNKLKTISPENLNWLKDSDVTWLYGPLHQAPSVPPTKIASTADKIGFDLPKSKLTRRAGDQTSQSTSSTSSQPSSQAKPILKKRSVTDILAMGIVAPRAPQSSSSPIYEAVTAELEGEPMPGQGEPEIQADPSTLPPAAGILKSSPRPALWHTKSDSILARQAMLSTSPMSVEKLSPPGDSALSVASKSASRSPPPLARAGHRSDSSSSYQVSDDSSAPARSRRHISFNSFVEQRVVVDPSPRRKVSADDRTSSDSESESEDEDGTVLEMRSLSGSSLSSSRRGSTNSQTSSDTNPRSAGMMTMITAPIAPTLLKEPEDLPAPSPAVVFVAPQGIDEETLKYEVHIASKVHFSVPADRRRLDTAWSPAHGDEYDQTEIVDYFSGVPVPEPEREPIYTDEDEDAITVRRRIRSPRSSGYFVQDDGTQWRKGQAGSTVGGPTPDSSETGPLRSSVGPRQSSFSERASEYIKVSSVSPPTISHDEIAGKTDTTSARVIVPRSGSASNLTLYQYSDVVGSAPRSSHLTSSLNAHNQGRSSSGRTRNRPRGASFEGVDMRGETSALSVRSKSNNGGLVRSQSAAVVSPAREQPVVEVRGRSQRITEELERPRRGRSLLRTNSSSTISERERSSTTTASTSPLGSLSPRSSSSVGIVGGYIAPPNGLGSIIIAPSASLRSSSGLRFESGSWSADEEQKIDGGDLAQIIAPSAPATAPTPESPVQAKPTTSGLVRTSSSTNIPAQTSLSRQSSSSNLVRTSSSSNIPAQTSLTSPGGIRRTGSSSSISNRPGMLQRTSSSSNIAGTVRPTPQLITSPVNEIPTVVLQPSSRRSSLTDIVGVRNLSTDIASSSPSTSLVSQSPESTGSFWRANELESPATPPSPADKVQKPSIDEPSLLQRELLLTKSSLKPRASGLSLASSTSNGSNSSNTTVVPSGEPKHGSSQLASVSSSASSTTSGLSMHRRSTSRSSHSAAPTTPPPVMRSSSSSTTTRHVTQAVATRADLDSPSGSASEKHLRRLSGGIGSPVEEKPGSGSQSPSPVSPGSVLSNVVGSARGLFDALWGNHDHNSS